MKPLFLFKSLRLGLGMLATLSPLVVQGFTVDPTTTYTLSHRFSTQETSQPHSTFTLPLPSLSDSIDLSPESVLRLDDDSTSGQAGAGAGELYHLHLSGEGVDLETSTKACYLSHLHAPQVQVHLSSSGKPIALSLSIPSIPSDGSCPPSPPSTYPQAPTHLQLSTTSPTSLRSPPLAPPVGTDSTGQPVTPPPEKSFLQKYWLPIAGLAVFALSQLGDPQPPSGQGQRPR